jgi:hypothetical protein
MKIKRKNLKQICKSWYKKIKREQIQAYFKILYFIFVVLKVFRVFVLEICISDVKVFFFVFLACEFVSCVCVCVCVCVLHFWSTVF